MSHVAQRFDEPVRKGSILGNIQKRKRLTIVQAVPSTGKTWCTANRNDIVDTDGLLLALTGDISGDSHERVLTDTRLRVQFTNMIDALEWGTILVTNMNLSRLSLKADFIVAYREDDYIRHIKKFNRTDLIDGFGEETLRNWAKDYEGLGDMVTFLKWDESLSDALQRFGL